MVHHLSLPTVSRIDAAGTYTLDSSSGILTVASGVLCTIVERVSASYDRTILLEKDARIVYISVRSVGGSTRLIVRHAEGASSDIRCLAYAGSGDKVSVDILSELGSDRSMSHLALVSIVGDHGSIHLSGDVDIASSTYGCDGRVTEEVVAVGDRAHMDVAPILRVGSGIVRASHSARIERIGPSHVWPLQLRGIAYRDAVGVLLSSLARRTVAGVEVVGIDPEEIWHDACARIMVSIGEGK